MGNIRIEEGTKQDITLILRTTKEFKNRLRALANKDNRSLASYVRNVLIEHVNKQV